MPKKEFKVGEVFQCGLLNLKCVEYKGGAADRCDECVFDDNGECIDRFDNIVGKCSHLNREDKTNVIFVKVED